MHEYFLSNSHQNFEDVSICLIDKTDPSDPHKREYYWMRSLKTIVPFGLNIEETLLLKVCKSECSIVTLLLHFYFLVLYVTCNVKGID